MITQKFTQAKVFVDGSYIESEQRVIAKVLAKAGVYDERGLSIEDEANAERLALCWNIHEQLLEALKAMLSAYSRIQQSTEYLPGASHRDLTDPMEKATEQARAAIAAATGE